MSMSSNDPEYVYGIWLKLKDEVAKVIVDLQEALEEIFICLIAQGHILLEGPPGIAKTTLAKTIAKILDLSFSRIQFTPDLLPADIIGTKIYDQSLKDFITKKGPIFANLILADEINRAGPKTQSALLEAMQERQVTIEGETFKLPEPFMVIATENPIEVEGTYALPSAQLDRFLIKSTIDFPPREAYRDVINKYGGYSTISVETRVSREEIINIQKALDNVMLSNDLLNYIVDLMEEIRGDRRVKWGVSPRGAIAVAKAAKAWALMNRRDYVTPEDIKRVFYPVVNHRIILTSEALFEGIHPREVLEDVLSRVKVPV